MKLTIKISCILFVILLFLPVCRNLISRKSLPLTTTAIPIDYPRDPTSVIIKAQITRKNLPITEVVLSSITDFCLYGDRTLFYRVEHFIPDKTSLPEHVKTGTALYSPSPLATVIDTQEKIFAYPEMKVVRLKEEEVQKLLNFIIVEKKFFNLQKSKEKKKDDEFSLKINTNKGGKTITFYSDGQKELIDIYNLLKNFDLSGAKPYKPEKILLSVYNVPDYMDNCTRKATIWMYNEINLENLSKEYTPHEFDKKAVDEIWDFFQKYPPDEYFYFQGDAVYGLLYRSYLRDELIRR